MRIQVALSGQLASVTGVSKQSLDLPDGAPLLAAIRALAEQHGEGFSTLVLNPEGETLRRSLLVAVEGEQVLDVDQPVLKEGSDLMLLTPIAGG